MKETLIQYQGGGYDGCFWEWNFGFFDKNGKYHDIFSSGRAGCKTQEQIEGYIKEKRVQKDYYFYRLTSEKALKEIATEINIVNLTGLLTWFDDNFPEYEIYALCSDCGCKITDSSESSLEDWHGCGGIMSTTDTLVCSECYGIGSCSYCGEYYGQDDECLITNIEQINEQWDVPLKVAETLIDNCAPVCIYCAEKLLKREIEQEIKRTKQ